MKYTVDLSPNIHSLAVKLDVNRAEVDLYRPADCCLSCRLLTVLQSCIHVAVVHQSKQVVESAALCLQSWFATMHLQVATVLIPFWFKLEKKGRLGCE
jgi:hypothetical protein